MAKKPQSRFSSLFSKKSSASSLEEKFAARESRDWLANASTGSAIADNAREAGRALRRQFAEREMLPSAQAAEKDLVAAVNEVAFGPWTQWLAEQEMDADPRNWTVAQTLRAMARGVNAEGVDRTTGRSLADRLGSVLETIGFGAAEREAQKIEKEKNPTVSAEKNERAEMALGGPRQRFGRFDRHGMDEKMLASALRDLLAYMTEVRLHERAEAAEETPLDRLTRSAVDETVPNEAWATELWGALGGGQNRAGAFMHPGFVMELSRLGFDALETGALASDPDAERAIMQALSGGPAAGFLMGMGMPPVMRGGGRGGAEMYFANRNPLGELPNVDMDLDFDVEAEPRRMMGDRINPPRGRGGLRGWEHRPEDALRSIFPALIRGLAPLARGVFREELARKNEEWKEISSTAKKIAVKTSDKKLAQNWLDDQIASRERAALDNRDNYGRRRRAALVSPVFARELDNERAREALAGIEEPSAPEMPAGEWRALDEALVATRHGKDSEHRGYNFRSASEMDDADRARGLTDWLGVDKLGVEWTNDDFSAFTQRAAKHWANELFARQEQAASAGLPKEAAFLSFTGGQEDVSVARIGINSGAQVEDIALRAAKVEASRGPIGSLPALVMERLKAKGWKGFSELLSVRMGLSAENGAKEIVRAAQGATWADTLISARKNPQNETETQIGVVGAFSLTIDSEGRWTTDAHRATSTRDGAIDKFWQASASAAQAFGHGWSVEAGATAGNFRRIQSILKGLGDTGRRGLDDNALRALKDDLDIAGKIMLASSTMHVAYAAQGGGPNNAWETRWMGAAMAESALASLEKELAKHGMKTAVSTAHLLTRPSQGDEKTVSAQFVEALGWIGQKADVAERIAGESAAGLFAARMARSQGWPLDERMEQTAKSELEKHGLTPAGWKLLRKMDAVKGDAISSMFFGFSAANARQQDTARASRVELAAIARLLSACAEANLSTDEAAALLARPADITASPLEGGYSSQNRTAGWARLGTVLALPQPVLSMNEWGAGEERAEKNRKSREKAAEKKLAELEKGGKKANREAIEAVRQRLIENAAQTDAEFWPEALPETPAERDTRLEMTRALGKWALESQTRASANARDLDRSAIARRDKIKDLSDWLENGPGGRAALPRRFGAQSLFDRMRQWHDELARAKALEGIEGRIREIKAHAGRAAREGHAISEEAVHAMAEKGRWPMAIERVFGAEIEEKSLAQERLAKLETEQKENPEKFEGVDLVEVARALREEARREAKTAPLSGWVAVGLANPVDLHAEGTQMRHCVASYATYCAQAASRIFRVESPDGVGVGTLELKAQRSDERGSSRSNVGGDTGAGAGKEKALDVRWEVAQFRGVHNATIYDRSALMFAQKVAVAYGEAAQANRLAAKQALKNPADQPEKDENAPATLAERLQAQRETGQGAQQGAAGAVAGRRMG